MKKLTRRALLYGAGAATGYAVSYKLKPALPSLEGARKFTESENDAHTLNDASELSATVMLDWIASVADYSMGMGKSGY